MGVKKLFKKIYKEEFEDPNEAFTEFLFSLIPKHRIKKILSKGNKYYYSILERYLK